MTATLSEQQWATIYRLYEAYSAPLYRVGAKTAIHIVPDNSHVYFTSELSVGEEPNVVIHSIGCSFSLRRLFLFKEETLALASHLGWEHSRKIKDKPETVVSAVNPSVTLQEDDNGKTVAE